MRRRDVVSLLGGAAVSWPMAGRAQEPAIGFLGAQTPEMFVSRLGAFHQGLKQTGFVEGAT
jgi:putative ABC transport system substrate-binding protein